MPPEAPEAAVEPHGDGSQPPAPPAPDQPAPPAPDQAPAKPTVPTSLSAVKPEEYRRVFTQRTQLWGAVRRELGLDGDLPTEDMVAMIRDLKSKAEGPPPGLLEGITDPRVIRQLPFWAAYVALAFVPQLVFWVAFTVVLGTLAGTVAAWLWRKWPA